MMGRQASPERLFHDFRLDEQVPSDHLLRQIDVFLDLEQIRQELKPFYSSIGRPSVDPELMVRMLIVGYCFGIRSERRLCQPDPGRCQQAAFCSQQRRGSRRYPCRCQASGSGVSGNAG